MVTVKLPDEFEKPIEQMSKKKKCDFDAAAAFLMASGIYRQNALTRYANKQKSKKQKD